MVNKLGQTETPRPSKERLTGFGPIFPLPGLMTVCRPICEPFLHVRPFYVVLVQVLNGGRISANGHT